MAAAKRPRRAAHRSAHRSVCDDRRRSRPHQGVTTADSAPFRAGAGTFAALFLVTLSTLTYQLLLTRTFSVTMYYHFAFVAISVTMFGMAVGAIVVYVYPRWFVPERVVNQLAIAAALFAATIVLSYLTHLSIPFLIEPSLVSGYALGLTYGALSVPFVMSGIVVSLALTRFPQQVGALYAADLAGAALGCLIVGPMLRVSDAPTAVLATAGIASVSAALFARERATHATGGNRRLRAAC